MHLPKLSLVPNIVSIAARRGVRTKAVVITMALVCTLFSGFALAGQGPSQYCSDGGWSDVPVINDPVTIGVEIGPSTNNPSWGTVCYSTTPWGSAATEVTGGDIRLDTPGQNGTNAYCVSDPAAIVRLDCYAGAGLNTSNPTSPGVNASSSNGVNVLGTPIGPPSVAAGTDCAVAAVAISLTSCAWGGLAGIGVLGSGGSWLLGVSALSGSEATGYWVAPGVTPGISISGTSAATGTTAAVSGTGCSWTTAPTGIAASGTGCAHGDIVGASVTGCATSWYVAVGGGGGCTWGGIAGASGIGDAYGAVLGISGTGTANASGSGLIPGVAISGMGPANGSFLSVSGTGPAYGNGINIDASTQLLSDANLPGDEEAATVSEITGALDLPEADELPTGGIDFDAHVNNVLSLIDETTNNPTAFANQATNSPESNMSSSEQKGAPSCKNITYRANAGSIYVQTSSWRYVQWGIRLYDESEESGPWWVNVYVNKTRVDAKSPPSQYYAPHGSIHPSDAKKGGTLRFEVKHQSNKTKRWYRSTTNGCRIPNYG